MGQIMELGWMRACLPKCNEGRMRDTGYGPAYRSVTKVGCEILIQHLLSAIRYPLSLIRYPLSVIRYLSSAIRYPLSSVNLQILNTEC
jgi:hypothetical protein